MDRLGALPHAQNSPFVFQDPGLSAGTFFRPSVVSLDATRQIHDPSWAHSCRSAISGSTRVARRAGSQHARNATPASNIATPLNVIASDAFTP